MGLDEGLGLFQTKKGQNGRLISGRRTGPDIFSPRRISKGGARLGMGLERGGFAVARGLVKGKSFLVKKLKRKKKLTVSQVLAQEARRIKKKKGFLLKKRKIGRNGFEIEEKEF